MKRLIFFTIAIITCIAIFSSCERDDICPADTPTTPLLVLRFFDTSNTSNAKIVNGLRVVGLNDDDTELTAPFSIASSDSIAIPLRVFENNTRVIFIRDFVAATTTDPEEGNRDTLTFNYMTEEVFLNRACGFITNYDLNDTDGVVITSDSDNWVSSTQIQNDGIIDNQNAAHVKIFH